MDVLGFKTFLENSLEKTIGDQVKVLLDDQSSMIDCKKAAGRRGGLLDVKGSLEVLLTECLNTSTQALTPHSFAHYVKEKAAPVLADCEAALLGANYTDPLQRGQLKGKWDAFNAIATDIVGLADAYLGGRSASDTPGAEIPAENNAASCDPSQEIVVEADQV